MGKYNEESFGPDDCRFEVHMGFWLNDTDFMYLDYGSGIFTFQTDDEEQARRVFDNIWKYMYRPWHNTIMGMYLHEKSVRYDGTYHSDWKDEIEMLWYWEDYEKSTFDHFYIPIYKTDK